MIKKDMRYATSQIFPKVKDSTGSDYRINTPLYGKGRCFLQPRAIERLNAAAVLLTKQDPSLRLMVYDCYRPMYVSQIMWDKVRDPIWVGASGKSGHNIGGTVDLTLATLVDGEIKEVDMGSPFDLFEKISSYIPNLLDTSSTAYKNRTLLRKVMTQSGMNPYDSEWWHFSLPKDKLENTEHLDLPL
jgi:D-alanyl-D-alanine dipeptidase